MQTYQGIPVVESSGVPDAAVWNGTIVKITKRGRVPDRVGGREPGTTSTSWS